MVETRTGKTNEEENKQTKRLPATIATFELARGTLKCPNPSCTMVGKLTLRNTSRAAMPSIRCANCTKTFSVLSNQQVTNVKPTHAGPSNLVNQSPTIIQKPTKEGNNHTLEEHTKTKVDMELEKLRKEHRTLIKTYAHLESKYGDLIEKNTVIQNELDDIRGSVISNTTGQKLIETLLTHIQNVDKSGKENCNVIMDAIKKTRNNYYKYQQ